MTVVIVLKHREDIAGVFSTRELAEKWISLQVHPEYYDMPIDEWQVIDKEEDTN